MGHNESDKTKRLTTKAEVGCKEARSMCVCVYSHSKEKGEHQKKTREQSPADAQYHACLGVRDREAWRAEVHGGHRESDTTERLN